METQLQTLIDTGYVTVRPHPTADLFIYNYTPKAQYERLWNEHTLACRGLILDGSGRVVARPFPKFFNLDEIDPAAVPLEPFEVYEKLDGSLGILYWATNQTDRAEGDGPFIATRGSFASDQAMRATHILRTNYAPVIPTLDSTKTYLFEIIYPENRIVVDYAGREDLILLAIIDTATGQDEPLVDIGFPVVKRFDGINDFRTLRSWQQANYEGFVIKFRSGMRLKIKLAEYIQLHRILTGVSNLSIWEYMSVGKPLEELLEFVPDEFYDWVTATKTDLLNRYTAIEDECRAAFRDLGDRKTTALYFRSQRYPSVLFKMLDSQPYAQIIWKIIRPPFQKAFRREEEI